MWDNYDQEKNYKLKTFNSAMDIPQKWQDSKKIVTASCKRYKRVVIEKGCNR